VTLYGFQGDGWFLAIPAGIAVGSLLAGPNPRVRVLGGSVSLSITGLIAIAKIESLTSIEFLGTKIGSSIMSWGLPLATVASIVGIIASIVGRKYAAPPVQGPPEGSPAESAAEPQP
jgi:hypothetical protein